MGTKTIELTDEQRHAIKHSRGAFLAVARTSASHLEALGVAPADAMVITASTSFLPMLLMLQTASLVGEGKSIDLEGVIEVVRQQFEEGGLATWLENMGTIFRELPN